MDLKDLRIYNLASEICDECWMIYDEMDWPDKKIMGDQWIRSIDSIAANIAEANERFHYLDKNRFFYHARGSLCEALHWTEILHKRGRISEKQYIQINGNLKILEVKLNNTISATYKQKNEGK
ncbi:MAG TPA: four helix bundle protein [Candidatus Uhrbacteria bacterium]|nr:four helix bundle protein [Candidatus Uhrbacteria bacterium]